MKKYIVTSCFLIAIGLLLWYLFSTKPEATSSIQFSMLDIGQGDSLLLRTPDHITILIDTGAGHQVVDALSNAMPWNDHHIDYLLLTHPDLDHYGGAQWILDRYTVGQILYNGDEVNGSDGFRKLLGDIRARNIPLRAVHQGEQFRWASGIRWKLLWPPAQYKAPSTNAGCVVSKISWGREDILLPCDLPSEQEAIMMRQVDVSAEILKAGHHGSKYSSATDFLAAVNPSWCLISAGRDNRYGHPNPAAMIRLRRTGCQVLTTIDQGTVQLAISSTSIDYLSPTDHRFLGLPMGPLLAILNPLYH